MVASWLKFKKPDVGMTLNGVLAGLVGITAPCATVTPVGAILIGLIAGVIVMYSVLFFDKIRIDDPVGAISVHGVCGVWGTLAAALFDERLFAGDPEYNLVSTLWVQVIGIAVAFLWTFGTAFALFKVLDAVVGLRVTPEEERDGLDFAEHGYSAYPDFQVHGGQGIVAGGVPVAQASSNVVAESRTAEA